MILPNGLLLKDWRAKTATLSIMRMRIAFAVFMCLTALGTVYHCPDPNHPVLPPDSKILSIFTKLDGPDGILYCCGPRLRCRIRPSSRRALLDGASAQFLREKKTIKLLVFLELGPYFDVCRGLRDLGTEAVIVDVELGIHSLLS